MTPHDKHLLQRSVTNLYKQTGIDENNTRTVYYGEVISIDDDSDGGRIKVRVEGIDNKISNDDLPWAYPELTKFFHCFPKVGEVVRITLENVRYPQRSRYWTGPIISQPHKVEYDSLYTALSTTNVGLANPDKAPSTFPNARGVYPKKTDVALIGRLNNDIILRENEIYVRTGKHYNNDNLSLNIKNPAILSQHFEENDGDYRSSTIIFSDKIALLSHDGRPKFKSTELNKEDRDKIFENAHPTVRGDMLVEVLRKVIDGILLHVHGYHAIPADRNRIIIELQKLNLDAILQKNIVIN